MVDTTRLLHDSPWMARLGALTVTLAAMATAGAFASWWTFKSRTSFEPPMATAAMLASAATVPVTLYLARRYRQLPLRARLAGAVASTVALGLTARLLFRAMTGPLYARLPFGWMIVVPFVLVALALWFGRVDRAVARRVDEHRLALAAVCIFGSALAFAYGDQHRVERDVCLLKCGTGDARDTDDALRATLDRADRWHLPTVAQEAPRILGAGGAITGAMLAVGSLARTMRRRRLVRTIRSGADTRFRIEVRSGTPGVARVHDEPSSNAPYRRSSAVADWMPI